MTQVLPVAFIALTASGCYGQLSAGYAAAFVSPRKHLARIEAAGGVGDFRDEQTTALETNVALHVGSEHQRVGLGGSLVYLPLSGWGRSFTPALRLKLRPTELSWQRGSFDLGGVLGVEAGVLGYGSNQTRGRDIYLLSVGFEQFVSFGGGPTFSTLYLQIGYGHSTSIGPTS